MSAAWTKPDRPLRLRAITCDILLRPVYLAAAQSPNIVDVVDLSAALHVAPKTLHERIQEQIDASGRSWIWAASAAGSTR